MPSGSGTLKGANMRKTYKKIIALCAVLIFALALIPVQSFAVGDPFTSIAVGGLSGASGAGLFGSMASASGFDISYSSGTSIDQADALWNKLNPDNIYFNGNKGQETSIDPITGTPTVYDYISVDIGDWLQAQNDFIDEFVSAYSVTDNSSGSFVGNKSFAGIPLYTRSGNNYSTDLDIGTYPANNASITLSNGLFTCIITRTDPYCNYEFFYNGVSSKSGQTRWGSGSWTLRLVIYADSNNVKIGVIMDNNSFASLSSNNIGQVSNTFNGTWDSNSINTGVFDGYNAAKVKIPHNSWSPSDPTNWNVAEFLEELTVKTVSDHASDIIIEDDSGPVPPPVPIPSTPLGDIPTDEWFDLFGLPVLEGQEEIHQDLQDFSSDVSEGIDDVIGELEDIESDVESIDTNIGIGNGLLGDLKSIGQSIQSTLSSILSGVTDLVQEIVLSTETFIAGLLNSIMGGFGGMFSTMREAFSIWHYVVEWVGSISTVFSWFWSVAGSTSYYIQLPIYASLAGAVVLAFYKRFGK